MRKDNLADAMREAKKFLERAKDLQASCVVGDYRTPYGAKSAAVKRSSMDLTKSLAKLRREW
jgi:hypothetical protein